jgi:Do/DeqQ family serine protease
MKYLWTVLLMVLASTSCSRIPTTYASSDRPDRPATTAPAGGNLVSYADVVDRVAPAVVTIRASRRVRAAEESPFFEDPLFRELFGGAVPRGHANTEVEQALGSGVLVRADGQILTNHHVVDGAQDIQVELSSHRTYPAKLVGSDAPSDLALLKIDAGNLPVLPLGDSDKVRVGDVCLAVGNPLGVGESVTSGIISAKGRESSVSTGSFQDFLQTDAPINQGNSGGAVVDTRGELIGISSQIVSSTGGNVGIGFAIPSNMAKNVMGQLAAKGHVQRARLGAGIQTVTSDLAPGFGMKEPHGVVVNSVMPDGPAAKAGMHVGDIITKINGKDVSDANALRNQIAGMQPGNEVTLTVSRDGKQQDVKPKLGELVVETAKQPATPPAPAGDGSLGITAVPLTPEIADQIEAPKGSKGVVIGQMDPAGPAAQAGLQPGDVIVQVNRQPVTTASDIQRALSKSGKDPALLLISRQGQSAYVAVPRG